MSVHCCDRMDDDLNLKCDLHHERYDCPDALVRFGKNGYGLLIHNGGTSFITINFCPWCGAKLPKRGRAKPLGK